MIEASLTAAAEGRLFWKLRWQLLRSMATEALQNARLRTSILLLLTAVFWVGMFLLFREGFRFLHDALGQPTLRAQIVHAVFNTFFFTLTFMIAMSSAIVLYGSLYRNLETSMLLTLPVRVERIVVYKYQEAVMVSCWGFVLLGTPLLIAYGLVNNASWTYYAMLGPYMLGFVMIPTSLGAAGCLLVAYAMPQLRKRALYLLGTALLCLIGYFGWQFFRAASQDMLTPAWLHDMLSRLQFTEQRLFPSWWLSSGLLAAAQPFDAERPASADAFMFLAVLLANALLLQLILAAIARRTFRPSFSRLQGLLSPQRSARPIFIDRLLDKVFAPFPHHLRSLMVKDIRMFRRDPVLWAQFLIFFGLLSLYVLSLRNLEYASTLTGWITMMSFTNVGVIALIYSTFATRFILPLISLEGRAFWVLGTAPMRRESVITGKFLLASSASIPPCIVLILISDGMLQIAQRMPGLVVVHEVAMISLCLTLSALAVGNGARFPNLRESSPTRIAAGFGGTLNLVESCLLIMAVLLTIGIPGYFWAAAHDPQGGVALSGPAVLSQTWLLALAALVIALAAGAITTVSLRMGWKAFRMLQP